MKTILFRWSLPLLISIPFVCTAIGDTWVIEQDLVHQQEATTQEEASKRKAAIKSEINNLAGHPWAGTYYFGNGLSKMVIVDLAPNSGFYYERKSDMGLHDRNYGTVEQVGDHLILTFSLPNKEDHGLAESLLIAPWDERVYLIPSDDIIGFCNQINRGVLPNEYALDLYLLRVSDHHKPALGKPSIPDEYKSFILDEPVETSIVQIIESNLSASDSGRKTRKTIVALNKGNLDGLLPEMILYDAELHSRYPTYKIISVGVNTSTCVIIQSADDKDKIEVGLKLSTREFD